MSIFSNSFQICFSSLSCKFKIKEHEKIIYPTFCLISIPFILKADDEKPIAVNDLPQEALIFIKTHFTDIKISYAKVESDFLRKSTKSYSSMGKKLNLTKMAHGKK